MTMRNEINAVDLAFVVDTTSSMGGLIQAAQTQMIAMLEEVTRAASINLWLGMIEYRDHPPQDTMLYKTYPFTVDMQEAQKNIRRLKVNGGGDEPEAVLDGISLHNPWEEPTFEKGYLVRVEIACSNDEVPVPFYASSS